jgi:dTDP-4-amino-4,6-dideoxygalactose transaminase
MSENTAQLAVKGGEKMIPDTFFKGRYHFGAEERAAVLALMDNFISSGNMFGYQGVQEEAFGKEFAEFLGGGYADGVNSGTNAVYVAIKALQLPPFSEVIVGCMTDPGGMMPIVINNCIPIIADVMPGSFNTGAAMIEPLITERTRAIVVAHIGGEPANMPEIMALARKYNLKVVEDCAQSHMAKINGQNVGTFGDAGAFSLMFGKHMCTGGQGGAVFTKSEDMYWNIRRAADRGKPFNLPGESNGIPAINCNMDELHAVIGRVQLKKLPDIVARRKAFVKLLTDKGMNQLKAVKIPELPVWADHCYWWWRLRIDVSALACSRDDFFKALVAEGLAINPSYHAALPATFSWFQDRAGKFPWNAPQYKGDPEQEFPCPNANASVENHFILHFYESWGEAEADAILGAMRKVEAVLAK